MTDSIQTEAYAGSIPRLAPADPSLIEELIETLNGRHRFLLRVTVVKAIAASILLVICIIQFFDQQTTMAMIAWATGAIMCSVSICGLAIYFWMEVDRVAISRDLKQVELQLALLTASLTNDRAGETSKEST